MLGGFKMILIAGGMVVLGLDSPSQNPSTQDAQNDVKIDVTTQIQQDCLGCKVTDFFELPLPSPQGRDR